MESRDQYIKRQADRFRRSILSAEWSDDGVVVYHLAPGYRVNLEAMLGDAAIKDPDYRLIECYSGNRLTRYHKLDARHS